MRRSRVSPVRGIRYEHDATKSRRPFAITRVNEGANNHNACHLAMRASSGLKRDASESGNLRKALLQFMNQLQRTLRILFRSERVKISEPCYARDPFVQTRVVLHGARA